METAVRKDDKITAEAPHQLIEARTSTCASLYEQLDDPKTGRVPDQPPSGMGHTLPLEYRPP